MRRSGPSALLLLAIAASACGGGAREIGLGEGATHGTPDDGERGGDVPSSSPPNAGGEEDEAAADANGRAEPAEGEGAATDPEEFAAAPAEPLGADAFPALSRDGARFALRRGGFREPVVVSFHDTDGEVGIDFVLGEPDPLVGDPIEESRRQYERGGFRPFAEPLVLEADAPTVERDGLSVAWDGASGRLAIRQEGAARPLLSLAAPRQRLFEPAPRGRCRQTGRRVRPTAVAVWIDLERSAALVAWRWDQVTCDSIERRFGLHRLRHPGPPPAGGARPGAGGNGDGPPAFVAPGS